MLSPHICVKIIIILKHFKLKAKLSKSEIKANFQRNNKHLKVNALSGNKNK
jgi:hypothetical protein